MKRTEYVMYTIFNKYAILTRIAAMIQAYSFTSFLIIRSPLSITLKK